ncbi:MAG: GSCFA domain-containing protein [Bacteroidales bacterium]|nr:GSCFA domain-containing protein [Bacteroidales bacterium]
MKTLKLTTPVAAAPAGFAIEPSDAVLFVGSCFAENMGARMQRLQFRTLVNPFGILYNPLSMAEAMRRCLDDDGIGEEALVCHDGLWHSWLHHGAFSHADKGTTLAACNAAIHGAHAFLQDCTTLVLTFGSAWCYTLSDGQFDGVVANCHKVPASRFGLHLATVDEVVAAWRPLVGRLLDSGKRIVLTVSPVRHGAYGAHGNQLGKAVLLLALHQLLAEFEAHPKGKLVYFPAYEIVMDELRDYRFYADDLMHPSPMAEEIVWQRFAESCMSEETIAHCDRVERQLRQAAHRPLHAD